VCNAKTTAMGLTKHNSAILQNINSQRFIKAHLQGTQSQRYKANLAKEP